MAALSLGVACAGWAVPGDLDTTLNQTGILISPVGPATADGRSVVVQRDGTIIVAGNCFDGSFQTFCVARYLQDGSFDVSFGRAGTVVTSFRSANNYVHSAAVKSDGTILLAGTCDQLVQQPFVSQFCVAKYSATGALDSSFASQGIAAITVADRDSYAESLAVQADGKVLLGGICFVQANRQLPCILRLSPSGALDTDFGMNGVVSIDLPVGHVVAIRSMVIQEDGKIVVGGFCGNGVADFCVMRIDVNGTRDETFGIDGVVTTRIAGNDSFGESLVVHDDGRITLVGTCFGNWTTACFARYRANGEADTTLSMIGWKNVSLGAGTTYARAAALQEDGKLLVGADCQSTSSSDFCVMRFLEDGSFDVTFAGTGQSVVPVGSGQDLAFSIALQRDGSVLLAGACEKAIGSVENPAYRRFCLARFIGGPYPSRTCTLNIDDSLVASAHTDAQLVVRYLLGYRGDALVVDSIATNPGRTNAEIETYLADLLAQGKLDADGDGQSLATTDGLLILRAMLGLTGDALTAGAVNTAHPNARNAQQILTWIESTHGVACLP